MNGGGANGSMEQRAGFNNRVHPIKNMNSSLISPRNSASGGGMNGSVGGHGSKTSNNLSAHNSEDSARTEDKTAKPDGSAQSKHPEGEDEEEDSEGKYKMVRHHVEKFFK